MSKHPLASHLRRLIEERRGGESINEFARHAGVNASGLHQILRGERQYVRSDTFDKIAAGLGMTPAELAGAIGQGPVEPTGALEELVALLRLVPDEDLATVKRVVRPFVVVTPVPPTKRGFSRQDVERINERNRRANRASDTGEDGPEDTLASRYHRQAA